MIGPEHDLVPGQQQAVHDTVAIHRHGCTRLKTLQQNAVVVRFQQRMPIRDICLIDAHHGIRRTAHGALRIEIKTATVVGTSQRTQHHSPLHQSGNALAAHRLRRCPDQQQVHPVHVQRVPGP